MGQTAGKTGSRGIGPGRRAAWLAGPVALAVAALLAVAPSAQAADGDFTGALAASASTVKMGSTFTVTESAINLGSTQVSGITVGIRRLGFAVVSSTPPRTGFCRIAGSATCSFLSLLHRARDADLHPDPQPPGARHLHPSGLDHPAVDRPRIRRFRDRDSNLLSLGEVNRPRGRPCMSAVASPTGRPTAGQNYVVVSRRVRRWAPETPWVTGSRCRSSPGSSR